MDMELKTGDMIAVSAASASLAGVFGCGANGVVERDLHRQLPVEILYPIDLGIFDFHQGQCCLDSTVSP